MLNKKKTKGNTGLNNGIRTTIEVVGGILIFVGGVIFKKKNITDDEARRTLFPNHYKGTAQ